MTTLGRKRDSYVVSSLSVMCIIILFLNTRMDLYSHSVGWPEKRTDLKNVSTNTEDVAFHDEGPRATQDLAEEQFPDKSTAAPNLFQAAQFHSPTTGEPEK